MRGISKPSTTSIDPSGTALSELVGRDEPQHSILEEPQEHLAVDRRERRALMALFGAPIAHEDHALRACYAALALQSAIRPYAEEVRRAQGMVLQLRVGLNSGEVVVRAIGNDLHM